MKIVKIIVVFVKVFYDTICIALLARNISTITCTYTKRVERRRIKYQREEVGIKAGSVGKIVEEPEEIDSNMVKMKYERLLKRPETKKHGTRKPTAKMGGLPEERPETGRGRGQVDEKGNNNDQWKI